MLPQWIEYNIIAGVDQFFFTDDCSTDNGLTKYWFNFYHREGFVTVVDLMTKKDCNNHVPNEFRLLSELYRHSRPLCKWMTQLDPDEYIFPNVDEKIHDCPANRAHCVVPLEAFLFQSTQPIHRFLLTIMSNEGHIKRPPGLIIDSYTHGDFFRIQLIKTVAQTKYFLDWKWPNYPENSICDGPLDNKIREKCMNLTTPSYKNSRFLPDELSEYLIYVDGMQVKCGQPSNFPFYIRHYQALCWEDHLEVRVKRNRSASNTPNGWAGDHNRAYSVWRSYNRNDHCPLGGEGYRKRMSVMVISSIVERLRKLSRSEEAVFENYQRWLGGERLELISDKM
jgi:hypothetical protein